MLFQHSQLYPSYLQRMESNENTHDRESVNHHGDANVEGISAPGPIITRVIIHGHHPNEGDSKGKLIHLPDSIQGLLGLAGIYYSI